MTNAVARDTCETEDLTHLHRIILLPTQSNTHAGETHVATRDPLAAAATHGDPSHSQGQKIRMARYAFTKAMGEMMIDKLRGEIYTG